MVHDAMCKILKILHYLHHPSQSGRTLHKLTLRRMRVASTSIAAANNPKPKAPACGDRYLESLKCGP